ncbi:MAG: 30S ribosomal protein S7, partial [Chloroflexi bacterium]
MPRRGIVERRPIPPDARYNSVLVQKFINKVMERGKKSLAERIVYRALDLAAEKLKKPQLEIFEQALRNASPSIEVKPKRVGGA